MCCFSNNISLCFFSYKSVKKGHFKTRFKYSLASVKVYYFKPAKIIILVCIGIIQVGRSYRSSVLTKLTIYQHS